MVISPEITGRNHRPAPDSMKPPLGTWSERGLRVQRSAAPRGTAPTAAANAP